MIRPTRRAVLVFLAGVPVALVAVLVSERLWALGLVYAVAALLLLARDALLARPAASPRFEIHGPDYLCVGESDRLIIDVSAARWPPGTVVEAVCDFGPNVEPPARRAVTLSAATGWAAAVPLTPLRRGTLELERMWLRWQGPSGLVSKQHIHEVGKAIPVLPNIRAVRRAASQYVSRDAFAGIKVQSQLGGGSEFEALRDYLPGFDHRWIDWKRSARHRKLVCKEFQAERNHNVILAFDTGHLMSEPLDGIARLDHGINAGLLLAYLCLCTGDRAGLYAFDADVRLYAAPEAGVRSFSRVMHATAGLEYRYEETNFTLGLAELNVRLRRRSLVVLFSEFVDTITAELMVENVERLANRHVVIFITFREQDLHRFVDEAPQSFGDMARAVVAQDFLRERRVVLERIRRLGAHCIEAPANRLAADLLNRYLTIRRNELV